MFRKSLALVFGVILLVACGNRIVNIDLGLKSDFATVRLTVEFPRMSPSSIASSGLEDVQSFVVIMSSEVYPSIVQNYEVVSSLVPAEIDNVRPGDWNIAVHLLGASPDFPILYRGATGLTVEPGVTYDVSVFLEATSGVGIDFNFVLEQAFVDESSGGNTPNLASASEMVMSSDGTRIYVASGTSGAITLFSRDATTGLLTWVATYEDGTGAITDLSGPIRLALSPDDNHLYATSGDDYAINVFACSVDTGELTLVEAFRDDTEGAGLSGAYGVVVSPDGAVVYVGGGYGYVVPFTRDSGTGELTELPRDQQVLDAYYTEDLENYDLAISPDGQNLYAIQYGYYSDERYLLAWTCSPTGSLTYLESFKRDTEAVGGGLDRPWTITISPDGSRVYVGNPDSSGSYIDVFSRSTAGNLTHLGSFGTGGSGDYVGGPVFGPDGTTLYVAGTANRSSLILTTDTVDGSLALVQPMPVDADVFLIGPEGTHIYGLDGSASRLFFVQAP